MCMQLSNTDLQMPCYCRALGRQGYHGLLCVPHHSFSWGMSYFFLDEGFSLMQYVCGDQYPTVC